MTELPVTVVSPIFPSNDQERTMYSSQQDDDNHHQYHTTLDFIRISQSKPSAQETGISLHSSLLKCSQSDDTTKTFDSVETQWGVLSCQGSIKSLERAVGKKQQNKDTVCITAALRTWRMEHKNISLHADEAKSLQQNHSRTLRILDGRRRRNISVNDILLRIAILCLLSMSSSSSRRQSTILPCEAFRPITTTVHAREAFCRQPYNYCRSIQQTKTTVIDSYSPTSSLGRIGTIKSFSSRSATPPSSSSRRYMSLMGEFFTGVGNVPFDNIGQQLFNDLDIGGALDQAIGDMPEAATSAVLESVGRDLLFFLMASVVVQPIAVALGVTPILGYLLIGAILGPFGLDVFSNSKADVELGDFGILFLLFSEGLEVSKARLQKLTKFLPLGLAQISLCAAVLTAAILSGPPAFVERFLPLDEGLINIQNPLEALVLALAGTLSTSAFVFPVLKERDWEEEESGQAATSILLLQDLAVAPLLVILPYVVGQGPTDYGAIGFLTAKATVGFGLVIYFGSYLLQKIFELVAATRSTETFVALCLLVAAGMGAIAKSLGLTDTAGAFAAGVLLANTNYRAQIQADILPFKGVLLGIFFMVAGSSFDIGLAMDELPTVIAGSFTLIVLKAITLFLATRVPRWMEPNRLPTADGVRIALLLSGGGEFAFVILALAEKLDVLPQKLGGVLTAIVLVTMALTPVIGEVAEAASAPFVQSESGRKSSIGDELGIEVEGIASDAVVVCGYESIGESVLRVLGEEYRTLKPTLLPLLGETQSSSHRIVAFDTDPSLVRGVKKPAEETMVVYGNGANPSVLLSCGITDPSAIFVAYQEHRNVLTAVTRLRRAFPATPIYARASNRAQGQELAVGGATEVIIEADELPRSAAALVWGQKLWLSGALSTMLDSEEVRRAAVAATGLSVDLVDYLLGKYKCFDANASGTLESDELVSLLRKSNSGIVADDEFEKMEEWVRSSVSSPLDPIGFCRLYAKAPAHVKRAIDDAADACLS